MTRKFLFNFNKPELSNAELSNVKEHEKNCG